MIKRVIFSAIGDIDATDPVLVALANRIQEYLLVFLELDEWSLSYGNWVFCYTSADVDILFNQLFHVITSISPLPLYAASPTKRLTRWAFS